MSKKQPKRKPRPGVDEYGRTPLHHAAADGSIDKVTLLLSAGADANVLDDDGWTPLHFAALAKSASVTEALLSAGAQTELKDSYGNTPLWRAVFSSEDDGTVIRLLLNAGANPNAVNLSGVTPLTLARSIANYDLAQFFKSL
jgi:ankyrin repeat protein